MSRCMSLCRLLSCNTNRSLLSSFDHASPVPVLFLQRIGMSDDVKTEFKTDKEIAKEQKSHMDDLPVPEGEYEKYYDKQNEKWTLQLFGGLAFLGVSVYAVWKYCAVYLNRQPPCPCICGEKIGCITCVKRDKAERYAPKPKFRAEQYLPYHAPYLLIGGGTASFGAFRSIRCNDPTAKVLLISNEKEVPYMRPPLSKELWYSGDFDAIEELRFRQWNGKERSAYYEPEEYYFLDMEEWEKSECGGVGIYFGKAIKVDTSKKKVELSDGCEISYDKLLIATGGKPKNIPFLEKASGEIQNRTILFRNAVDFLRLNHYLEEAKAVAIIGGGFLGSELACALAKRARKSGLKVYQIFPENGNMGKVLPEYLCRWTTAKVRKEGVEVIPNTNIISATQHGHRVKLGMSNGKEIEVDYIIPAVGVEPNTDLARPSGLETDDDFGGFLVNAELEARTNIWAAGDAACFYDVKLGRRRVEHHDHAVVSGRLAGENMTGAAKPYWHQSMFWSDLGPDIGYEAIGIVDSSLPTTGVFAKATEEDTPRAVVQRTGEGIRSETERKALELASCNTMPKKRKKKKKEEKTYHDCPDDIEDDEFGKGVVFYRRNQTVVGILLWNCFNRMPIARKILRDGAEREDLYEVAKLFNLHEGTEDEDK